MEPFLGTILAFGFNYPPKGWAYCDGSILPISRYTALFSLLGTYYGGDGKTTFALPNLKGRTAIGFGNGPGGEVAIGETGGAVTTTVNVTQMPAHTHAATSTLSIPALADSGDLPAPANNALAMSAGVNVFSTSAPDVTLAPFTANGNLSVAGAGIAMSTISPYIVLNYSIAMSGIFPSRD